jgi:hypothetical protein
MPTGYLMWDDYDPGSGKVSEHLGRQVSWKDTAELIKICGDWVRGDGSVPAEWREEDLEAELANEGRACVGEMGSQQYVFYHVILEGASRPIRERSSLEGTLCPRSGIFDPLDPPDDSESIKRCVLKRLRND